MNSDGKPVSGFIRSDVDCSLDIDLDVKLVERLQMPIDGMPVVENCNCPKPTQAVIKTCWTGEDKGRRMITCPLNPDKGCNLKVWMDAPFSTRARRVIDHMYHIIENLEFENAVGLGIQNMKWADYVVENGQSSQLPSSANKETDAR